MLTFLKASTDSERPASKGAVSSAAQHPAQLSFFVVVGLAGLLLAFKQRRVWLGWFRRPKPKGGRGFGRPGRGEAASGSILRSASSGSSRWGSQRTSTPPRSPMRAPSSPKVKNLLGLGVNKTPSPTGSANGSRSPSPLFFTALRGMEGKDKEKEKLKTSAKPTPPKTPAPTAVNGSSIILPGSFSATKRVETSSSSSAPSTRPPSPPSIKVKSDKRLSGESFKAKLKQALKKDKSA